jgi:transcriptional regulator with XRE-family HTH domain
MKIFAERLKASREKARIDQKRLAENIGLSVITLSRYENGHRKPNTDDLQKLAVALDTSVAYLMGETDDPKPKNTPLSENAMFSHSAESAIVKSDPRTEVFNELASDPRKFAAAALISDMNDDQLRKVYDFLYDQKQLAEMKRQLGA